MNVYDSARMADVLAPLGYSATEDAENADMVILNTCHIREKAAEKVYSELGRLRLAQSQKRERGEQMILAVAGCVAQAEGEEILRRAPYVDMVFGPQTYHQLPQMVAEASRAAGQVLNTEFPAESKFDHMPEQTFGASAAASHTPSALGAVDKTAFLTVQEGCDKFCTYCVVPYTRGSEFSRPVSDVLREARALAAGGVMEITLLGQNVNCYHGTAPDGKGEWGLGRLIREVAEIEGIERIRYTTSYPADVDDDLIKAHGEVEKLMPYLHLPVQSGSDRVLKAMNRRHGADEYRHLVARLREARPDLGLSSDFIVGFPGESDADFEATYRLVEETGFVQAYSFKFSPRPGTPAEMMDLQIEETVKGERLSRLQDLLNAQQRAFNESCKGKTMPILLERPGKYEGQLAGRSPYMQAVIVDAPEARLGELVDAHITDGHANSLVGRLVSDSPASRYCA